uniref:Uncharacterized protein n=1 Tax=Lactuca sativa TaxID=4236 RepID=A0A9R1VG43_LACSA|nr:hypothetical protein LSAT_V11C500254270 [Lactuca sativa]
MKSLHFQFFIGTLVMFLIIQYLKSALNLYLQPSDMRLLPQQDYLQEDHVHLFLDSVLPNEETDKSISPFSSKVHPVDAPPVTQSFIYLYIYFIYLLNFIFSIIGALLGTYEDNIFKSESKKPSLKSIDFLNLGGGPELEKKLKYIEHVCSGVILGKELVNAPPNVLTHET